MNRVFYDDYITEMEAFQIDKMELMYNELPGSHLSRLKAAFPGRRDFSYGGRYRLIVRKQDIYQRLMIINMVAFRGKGGPAFRRLVGKKATHSL